MFNIQKNTMKGVTDDMTFTYVGEINADLTHWNKNMTPPNPYRYYQIYLNREVSKDDIMDMKLDLMPGFRLMWNYNKKVIPEAKFDNEQFVR